MLLSCFSQGTRCWPIATQPWGVARHSTQCRFPTRRTTLLSCHPVIQCCFLTRHPRRVSCLIPSVAISKRPSFAALQTTRHRCVSHYNHFPLLPTTSPCCIDWHRPQLYNYPASIACFMSKRKEDSVTGSRPRLLHHKPPSRGLHRATKHCGTPSCPSLLWLPASPALLYGQQCHVANQKAFPNPFI